MKIVTPPLIVKELDGFSKDILERKFFGEKLLNLISNTNESLVISLDGKWGEGKTTFVKMWQGLLTEENIHSIYFDAFANDYVDDAFISIVSEITNYANDNVEIDNKEKINELKNKAKEIGCHLISWSAKVGIKAATLGVIKESEIEELKDIKKELSTGASNFIGKLIDERITSHKKILEQVISFRELLSEIPSKLKNNNNSLVIIIDELDRCKPTFAVEIIEKIKHLFSVENIVFVLVMNKEQLEESIKSVYGNNIDSHTYLQKFISLETTIPKNHEKQIDNDFSIYTKRLIKLHEIEAWGEEANIVRSITALSEHFNLSLRQLEKVFTNLTLFYASTSQRNLRIVPIISFLAVIKVINPSLYNRVSNEKINFEELCHEVDFTNISEENRILFMIIEWIRFAMISDDEYNNLDEKDKVRSFGNSLWQYNLERKNIMPFFSKVMSIFIIR